MAVSGSLPLPRARAVIALGALSAVLGVALTGSAAPTLGGVLLLAGWLALVVGIHSFGRAGSG
jgi:uncharacterized membrane protein YgdD (TMEM256/DUF423 family)